jgi:hypothetical protein
MRCCAELADTAARTARVHAAVGKRIQAWAGEHHRDALDAAWAEITGGREDAALGEVDVQLIAAWIFNDRELPGGGTAAECYSRLDDLDADERDIAARIAGARLGLMRVARVAPGLWIELEDRTRQDAVRVISHGVSAHTSMGDLIVARRMDGPPAPSLWGPVGFVTAENGPHLSALKAARIDSLGLEEGPAAFGRAIRDASMEITILLSPGLRQPARQRRAA